MCILEKIKLSEQIIKNEYDKNNGNVFVSFSGGKDSTVLLHLARKIIPNIKAVFSNTTNEDIDIVKYVKSHDNIIWVKPKMNFKAVVKKYGFPLVSKEVSQKVYELKHTKSQKLRDIRLNGYENGSGKLPVKWRYLVKQDFDVNSKCCAILKKNPIEQWQKQNNMKPLIALMQDESALRKQLALYGKEDGKKVYPFLRTGWNDEDIWRYAKINNIRFADCYYDRFIDGVLLKAETRTGCIFCGFGIHLENESRFEKQKIKNPKRYETMMSLENNGVSFKNAIDVVLNNIAKNRFKK